MRLAPFDQRPHELLLTNLARRGRIRDGEEHLAAALRSFASEGLDCAPLRRAWQAARATPASSTSTATALVVPERDLSISGAARRASIAVMPFADSAPAAGGGRAGEALAHDVITRVAQLRSLFVIAQGTVFALQERGVATEEAARPLNVDYIVSGSLQRVGRRLNVHVELAETQTAHIIWAEVFDRELDDALLVLDEIGNRIVALIASEIETAERNRAILRPPNSLDTWEAHHRGLWHMYRFSKSDNARARPFFEIALQLDPTFARAHAGLSFTHWQDAFQGWTARAPAVDLAFAAAGQSVMADDRDPAAHWAMGRALWLRGHHDQSVGELERTIDLSPNFAMGHYALAFVRAQTGDSNAAIACSDQSRLSSPFDPLFAMLATRAMALVRLQRFEEAAGWAAQAASRPNAHPHVLAIAAFCLALAGSIPEARALAAGIRKVLPNYSLADFLNAFQYEEKGAALFRTGAQRIGMG